MTKQNSIQFFTFLLLSFLFISCSDDDDNDDTVYEEVVVVANRGSSNISFVNAVTNEIISTLEIPNSEPMYVVYVPSKDKVYVGDRQANKVHVINPKTKLIENSIDVVNGVFHMWADGSGNFLWANNTIDESTSVIDLNTNSVAQTIDLGITPHDVFVNNEGSKAYISVLSGTASVADSIYMYSTATFEKMASRGVGKDPHVFHLSNSNELFVPCQSGTLFKLDGDNLDETSSLDLAGTHGIFSSSNQSKLFVANIGGDQLYTINASDNTLIGDPVDTPESTPHNITVNEASNKIFVTHSGGTADKLSTYSVTEEGTITPDSSVITIGTNPFGVAYYKRAVQ